MNLKSLKVLLLFVLALSCTSWADTPTITGVTAKQRWPWNGKVDITYEVTGDVNICGPVALLVSAVDRMNSTNYVAAVDSLSGDIGTEEGVHHIVWDLNVQSLKFKSDSIAFRVAYVIQQYCVIDLSAGANAMNYPTTFMSTPPSEGFNTDNYKTTKLALRLIAPGAFLMGGRYHVTLTKPYYIGIFEVTQKQYELVTGNLPSDQRGEVRPVESLSWNIIRGSSGTYNWPDSENVDPNSFMGKIRLRTGINFDLPTEAQWEYACRAGKTSKYNNGGDSVNDLTQLGRYSNNQSDGNGGYSSKHTTVGSYLPNAWGVYDMHGNVYEWCLDWYGSLSDGVTDPVGPSSGSCRVFRGGCWNNEASQCTSSYRNNQGHNYSPSTKGNGFGFRLVRTMGKTDDGRYPKLVAESECVDLFDMLCVGDSVPVTIDSREDLEVMLDSMTLPWDVSWISGDTNAVVVISDNGVEVKRTTGSGEFMHALSGIGRHDLTYTTYIDGLAQDEVYAATVFKDWKYEVVDGGAVITETTQTSGEVTIPSEIDGYPVTGVASGTFENCSGLTTVYIPQGYAGRTDVFPSATTVIHLSQIVAFDATGGTVSPATNAVEYGSPYGFLPEPSRTGYTFAGWKWNGQSIISETTVTAINNHTLTACWSANRYVVELNPNGGSLNPDDSTIEVVFDSEYGELPCPERIGYSFTGWTASLIDADVIEPDSLATTNQILYALWEANPYQVVYEANNGSGETDRADAVYDEDVEIAANPFVWMGHVFVGWSTSADGEAVYEPGQIVRNLTSERDGEVTLYAIWEPLVVATPVITPGDGASFVGDTCLVTISCATDGADIYFSTRGTPPRIRESYRYSGAFEITDTTCVMAIALKENVTSEVAVVTISRRELTIPEAAGAMELTFETGGDADWVPMADVSAASGYSVRSGAIGCASYGTSNVTWLATEVGGAGTFSFRWKVDCEHDYTGMYLWDRLVVFTNDVEAAKIDGSQDWADVSLQFADSGRHSIRWLFLKDDEDDDGASFEDCAWVSGVKWTPAIVVADTEYDIGEMPESVAVQPGVTLSIKVESEPTESDIAALAERVTVSPKSSEQNAEYFKVVGNYDSAKESIALKVVIDEEAIGLAVTSQEVLDAVVDKAFSAGEVLLVSAKPGLYYGIVVVDDLSKMEAASVDVVFVKAGENGVRLTIPKPQGPSAFFKIVVSDVGNE